MAERKGSRAAGAPRTGRYVALLRGINVGGKNKLPMADLRAMFTDAGAGDVRTYIQSGNVVFTSGAAAAEEIRDEVARRIARQFGFQVPVVVRSGGELRKIVAANPFVKSGRDAASLHVAFLAEKPERGAAGQLDPDRSPGDSFRVIGREVYLHLPNGVAPTKLTNDYFDSKLGTTSTVRNWRTVLKVMEMVEA